MQTIKRLVLLFVMLLAPVFVSAAVEPDYEVTDVYIAADIDMLGSIHVQEAIVIKGALNGFIREVEFANDAIPDCEPGEVDFKGCSFYNARGLSLSKVSASKVEKDDIGWGLLSKQYSKFEEVDSASSGESGKYEKYEHDTGMEIKTYNVNEDGYIVYIYDYYINQAVVLHEDIAELYFTFFRLDEDVKNEVNIQVTTPGTSTQEAFRFWAHGTLSGEIAGISEEKNDNGENLYKGVLSSIDAYQAGQMIDIRMTMDKSMFSAFESVLNDSGQVAFNEILEIEQELADEANRERTLVKVKYYVISGLGVIYLIGLVVIWIYIYRKYDREYDVNFDHKYYREFTGEYDVEVVDYLMTGDVSTNAFNASIMNLIYKKNIKIEELADAKNKKKDITLHLVNKDNASASETLILNLLFDDIGNGKEVTLKEIEKYSSNYKTAENFKSKFDAWKMSVEIEGRKEEFFEKHTHIRAIASLYFVFGIVICFLILMMNIGNYILLGIVGLGGIAFLIYALTYKKWTKKGREHYLKWGAFKNFLKDFGSLKDKEIPEIALWDRYLVYATLFGIAKEVQKSMKIVLVENNMDASTISTTTIYRTDFAIINSINNSMGSAYSRSVSTINAHIAASGSSSGSGFGGGFSGGGGFAGGGGGGGRGF